MEASALNRANCSNVVELESVGANATISLSAEDRFLQATRFIIQRILVPIVVTVGVVGNGATIVVLTRRRMRSSTNIYLTALAVSDLLYLVAVFLLSFVHYPNNVVDTYWHAWPFFLWLTDSMSSMSIWLTVTFTVERYVAVCHPMRGRLLCTEQRAKRAVFAIALLSLLTTSTVPWEWNVIFEQVNGTICVHTQMSELGNDQMYRNVFYWFNVVVFTVTPLILLAIFNCFLVCAVHRSHRQRQTMTQSVAAHQRQENRITVILIAVVILFMVCQSPAAILLVYSIFRPSISKIQRGLGNIFNFLVAVNAATNFLLYCALSDKYRRTFVVTFFPRCFPSPTAATRRSASMYSTHSDYTRARSGHRVTNSVYLSVPVERNGRTAIEDVLDGGGGGGGGGDCDGDVPNMMSSVVTHHGDDDSHGNGQSQMI